MKIRVNENRFFVALGPSWERRQNLGHAEGVADLERWRETGQFYSFGRTRSRKSSFFSLIRGVHYNKSFAHWRHRVARNNPMCIIDVLALYPLKLPSTRAHFPEGENRERTPPPQARNTFLSRTTPDGRSGGKIGNTKFSSASLGDFRRWRRRGGFELDTDWGGGGEGGKLLLQVRCSSVSLLESTFRSAREKTRVHDFKIFPTVSCCYFNNERDVKGKKAPKSEKSSLLVGDFCESHQTTRSTEEHMRRKEQQQQQRRQLRFAHESEEVC